MNEECWKYESLDTIVPQLGSMVDKTDTISTADRDKLKGLAQKWEFADFIKEFNKIAKDSSGNTIASPISYTRWHNQGSSSKMRHNNITALSATAIPATPPTAGTTNMPTINKTHITVNGTAPIATGWTSSAEQSQWLNLMQSKQHQEWSWYRPKNKTSIEHIDASRNELIR